MPWVNVRGHFLLANWCRRDKPTVGGPIPGQVGLGWYLTLIFKSQQADLCELKAILEQVPGKPELQSETLC